MKQFSEDAIFAFIETADIGGTNATSDWKDMADFDRVTGLAIIGTWDGGDDLDGGKLQQADTIAGGNVKDLTSSESGGNYDTDAPLNADGDELIVEARAEDLDVDGGFHFVRFILSEAGNTGVDNVTGVMILHGARYTGPKKQGAASLSRVYANTDS